VEVINKIKVKRERKKRKNVQKKKGGKNQNKTEHVLAECSGPTRTPKKCSGQNNQSRSSNHRVNMD